jgi:hypothetical protein
MFRRCCAVSSGSFPLERLLRFLVALDQDVEIVVKPHRDTNNAPALQDLTYLEYFGAPTTTSADGGALTFRDNPFGMERRLQQRR